MDYFFSKLFRSVKYGLSILGAASAIVIIVTGALSGSIVIPICGGLSLIPAGFIFFENTKIIRDMEKAVTKLKRNLKEFEERLDMLNETVGSLKDENNNYKQNNVELKYLLKEAEIKVDQLADYVDEYKASNKEFKKSLEKSERNNDELQERAQELLRIKDAYEKKISELNEVIEKIQNKLEEITAIKDDYEEKLLELNIRNQELEVISKEFKHELENVRKQYDKAKEVITSLLNAKEVLEEVHNNMIQTVNDMSDLDDDLRTKIERYDEIRNTDLFNQLDKNKDGQLSLEEFLSWYSSNI